MSPFDRRSTPPGAPRPVLGPSLRRLARWMFYSHLWLGVIVTGVILILSVSGVLLNHKRALGLMPDVPHEPVASFSKSLPLPELALRAEAAAPSAALAGIDRMDVRPRAGVVKVRFRDDLVTEVTLDLHQGRVLHLGPRNDVFLEKLHTGEIFGDAWILLSDFGAVALVIMIATGYWLWLFPRSRH